MQVSRGEVGDIFRRAYHVSGQTLVENVGNLETGRTRIGGGEEFGRRFSAAPQWEKLFGGFN